MLLPYYYHIGDELGDDELVKLRSSTEDRAFLVSRPMSDASHDQCPKISESIARFPCFRRVQQTFSIPFPSASCELPLLNVQDAISELPSFFLILQNHAPHLLLVMTIANIFPVLTRLTFTHHLSLAKLLPPALPAPFRTPSW